MAFLIDLAGEVLGENEMANRQPEKWKETLALTPKQATSGPIPGTQHSPTFSCIEWYVFFVAPTKLSARNHIEFCEGNLDRHIDGWVKNIEHIKASKCSL